LYSVQQFLVPQFIDVENKILGPITVRQFVLIILTVGMLFLFYKSFDFSAFLVATLVMLPLTVAFAFLKVNGMPFHYFILNVIQTSMRPGIRVWAKQVSAGKSGAREDLDTLAPVQLIQDRRKVVNRSRLNDLSLVVNTGGYFAGDDDEIYFR